MSQNADYVWPEPPPLPALEAWWERDDHTHSDRPRVSVWMPTSAPFARLQTTSRSDRSEYLPQPERPIAYLTLGSVDFGGYLSDLEALVDAARDALRLARWQADCLIAEAAQIDGSES